MVDLHRHDEGSTFDGFDKPLELAKIAKELGHTSLSVCNHGVTTTLVQHYYDCHEVGVKPILGVEGYFLPVYKPQTRGYHLCAFAKNAKGYENLNTLQFRGESHKYYNPIWTFEDLEACHEGLICTSACVASYTSKAIIAGKPEKARKALQKFIDIFGDDFYVEIQPYVITDEGVQEMVNEGLMDLAYDMGIKMVLTSDSHRGRKEDLPTYLKMHEMAKHNTMDVEATYAERYMPSEAEIVQRFVDMHWKYFGTRKEAKREAKKMIANLEEIESKVDGDLFEGFTEDLPVFDPSQDSHKLLVRKVKEGLKKRGKYNKQYIDRAKEELDVISFHHFEDYFLMVQDYVLWAKGQGIWVGPGRGSGCNSIVNYALYITDVDSIAFDLDFTRFLNKEKKKMPDIDLDFQTSRRGEVIEYLLKRYPNNSAQIANYGLYKVDNLINDLCKSCGVEDKDVKARMKKKFSSFIESGTLDKQGLLRDPDCIRWNKDYDNICIHYTKMFKKLRFIGTHAAGVAISGHNLLERMAMRIDSKTGKRFTSYDLADVSRTQVIKFDILGLSTGESIQDTRNILGITEFNYDWLEDEEIMKHFNDADTDGIFQFVSDTAKDILKTVGVDSFKDIIAAAAMCRPGPLSLKIPELYAENKRDQSHIDTSLPYYKYIEDTYGTILYQEQIQAINKNIGGLSQPEADKIIKMDRGSTEEYVKAFNESYATYLAKFTEGAKRFGMTPEQSEYIFSRFFNYAFNKGHSTGYSLISVEEMYYRVYHPAVFWYSKLRYAGKDDQTIAKFKCNAIKDDTLIFLPHVNYSGDYSLRRIDGEYVIQEGLVAIKGVGEKAAHYIEAERKANGIFRDYDDFYDRCKSRVVHSGVINLLKEAGALEFSKKTYLSRVKKYNSALYVKAYN